MYKKPFIPLVIFFFLYFLLSLNAQRKSPLPNQDVIMKNLFRYVSYDIKDSPLQELKSAAVKEIIVNGEYQINDRLFETLLIDALVKNTNLIMVERQALDILLEEQNLSLMGLTDEEESKIGKLIGVDGFLYITVDILSKRKIAAHITLLDGEKGTTVWSETFTGEYYRTAKTSIGAYFRLPTSYTESEDDWEIDAITGPIFGLRFNTGKQFLDQARFLELGLNLSIESDFFMRSGDFSDSYISTDPEDLGDEVTISNGGFISFSFFVVTKFHISELFNSPKDLFRPYLGFGSSFDFINSSYESDSDSDSGSESLTIPELMIGIEFLPIRDFSIYIDYRFRLTKNANNILLEESVIDNYSRHKLSIGLMYYFNR
jgi:hypothetical protein